MGQSSTEFGLKIYSNSLGNGWAVPAGSNSTIQYVLHCLLKQKSALQWSIILHLDIGTKPWVCSHWSPWVWFGSYMGLNENYLHWSQKDDKNVIAALGRIMRLFSVASVGAALICLLGGWHHVKSITLSFSLIFLVCFFFIVIWSTNHSKKHQCFETGKIEVPQTHF